MSQGAEIRNCKVFSMYVQGTSATVPDARYIVIIEKAQYSQSAIFAVDSYGCHKIAGSTAVDMTASRASGQLTLNITAANYAQWFFIQA